MVQKEKRVFDFSELLGRIIAKYGTRSAFAEAIGMKENVLSSRLRNKTVFTPTETLRICELLDIQPADIPRFFYTPMFHFSEQ